VAGSTVGVSQAQTAPDEAVSAAPTQSARMTAARTTILILLATPSYEVSPRATPTRLGS
jgi:hypothetical protein